MKRWFVLLILPLTACVSSRSVGTSDSPAKTWTPPASVAADAGRIAAATPLPAGIEPGATLSLPQIIDVALRNNPQTRIAWLNARAAEAGIGVAQSNYYPEVDLDAGLTRARAASTTGASTATVFGPSLTLNYLLFDFGGREAEVEQARQTLIAADYLHNQAIQDVILRVQQAYYGFLDAKALLAAQDATIKERQTSLDSADARHNSGVATIADVLQARTALSQAQLTRETFAGSVRTFEGEIATAMGLPAATHFEFGELPSQVPSTEVTNAVENLITQAVQQRPDVAASRAEAERAQAHVTAVRSSYLPALNATSSLGETFFGTSTHQTPYSAGLAVRWPVFTGFRNTFDVRQAQTEADIARESIRNTEQQVMLQVWTSYYSLQTATQRLATSRDLLASAQQSADVAQSRYRAGVGSILDVLTAEAALENARAQEVQSRADWFLSVAQLAHDTGTLEVK
ncbi:MAG TPA: TolC family protein [Thermoanaerobaculia bacterium]|jgi:TolC family type I secretion outer membrane protein|nr:TolC family protein [Thermoanaerobaculia bacterium]